MTTEEGLNCIPVSLKRLVIGRWFGGGLLIATFALGMWQFAWLKIPIHLPWYQRLGHLPFTLTNAVLLVLWVALWKLETQYKWTQFAPLRGASTRDIIGLLDKWPKQAREALIDELLLRARRRGRSMARAYFYGQPWEKEPDTGGSSSKPSLRTRWHDIAIQQEQVFRFYDKRRGAYTLVVPGNPRRSAHLVGFLIICVACVLSRDLRNVFKPELGNVGRLPLDILASGFAFLPFVGMRYSRIDFPSLRDLSVKQLVMVYIRGEGPARSEAMERLCSQAQIDQEARGACDRLGIEVPQLDSTKAFNRAEKGS